MAKNKNGGNQNSGGNSGHQIDAGGVMKQGDKMSGKKQGAAENKASGNAQNCGK